MKTSPTKEHVRARFAALADTDRFRELGITYDAGSRQFKCGSDTVSVGCRSQGRDWHSYYWSKDDDRCRHIDVAVGRWTTGYGTKKQSYHLRKDGTFNWQAIEDKIVAFFVWITEVRDAEVKRQARQDDRDQVRDTLARELGAVLEMDPRLLGEGGGGGRQNSEIAIPGLDGMTLKLTATRFGLVEIKFSGASGTSPSVALALLKKLGIVGMEVTL